MNDYYLTVKEVADRYNVTTNAVYYWIKNGLKTKRKRVIGKGSVIVIGAKEVNDFLNLGIINDEE